MHYRFIATAGAAAMMLAVTVHGQEAGDPIVYGEEQELEWFRLTDVRASAEITARYRDESVRRGDEKRRGREIEFRETVELFTRGFMGHPNLFEFELMGRFTPTQRRTNLDSLSRIGLTRTQILQQGLPTGVTGGSAWEFEYITEYDFVGRILQESDLPITLFSRRTDTTMSRPFGETFDTTTMQHGIRAAWHHDTMPGSIQYFFRDTDTRSRSGIFDNRIEQHTVQLQNRFQIDDQQELTVDYTFDDVRQIGPGTAPTSTRAFQRHDALLTHNLDFGENRQHSLRSQLHFFDESGAFDIRRLRLFELLRLRHSSRFETRYDYTFDWIQRPGVDQKLHRGQAGFQHRLFESLVTTANVGASYLTLTDPDFSSTELFGDIDFQYTKEVPYGRLNASASFRYSHRQDSDRSGPLQVINEPHTFSAAGIIVISRRLIEVGSIVITDSTGTFTYSAGLDYIVIDFRESVEIRRVVGGNIADGESVLISYRFGDEPGRTTDTFSMRYTARYDFEEGFLSGLGLYGRYFQQDQWRSGEPEDWFLPPQDIREIVYGADYRIGYFTFLAERTHRDSTISPFDSTRLEARYARPLGHGSSLLFTGTWLDIDRYEDDIRTEILTLSGRWNQQLTERLHMGVELQWRDERNSHRFNLQGFEQRLDLNWRYRQTTIYGSLRNAWLDSDVGRSRFHDVFIGLRREF
jgi:hypothetical protein